jgi:hypothetical protein
MPSDEMFYIDENGQKSDADIHEFILSREGLPEEPPPVARKPLDPEDKTN